MLDPISRLEILKNMDIPVWARRNDFLLLDKPLINAKVAVLLSKPLKPNNVEEKKVLLGMLSVLALEKTEYWIGWLNEMETGNQNIQLAISQMIKRFAPQKILFLGEAWTELLVEMDIDSRFALYYTFHPEELIKMPEKKKKAHQILLNLKQTV